MDDYTAILNQWWYRQITDEEMMVWGIVVGDKLGRFEDGTVIHTSGVKNRTMAEGDIVTTRNNKYLLGNKAPSIDNPDME